MASLKTMLRATSKGADTIVSSLANCGKMAEPFLREPDKGAGEAMANEPSNDLDKRLKDLEVRLAERTSAEKTESKTAGEARKGYSQAIKLSSEFIAGILVGVLLGYLFDTLLGTHPWGMIVFLMLGFCAAVLNVLRAIGAVAEPKIRKDKSNKI